MNIKLGNRNFVINKKDLINSFVIYSLMLTIFGFIEPTFKQAFYIASITSLTGLFAKLVLSGFNKNKIKKQSNIILN